MRHRSRSRSPHRRRRTSRSRSATRRRPHRRSASRRRDDRSTSRPDDDDGGPALKRDRDRPVAQRQRRLHRWTVPLGDVRLAEPCAAWTTSRVGEALGCTSEELFALTGRVRRGGYVVGSGSI